MFIVFEGIDGSGTTTQVKLLCDALAQKGFDVVQTAEPTDGEIGRFIRLVLSGEKKLSPKALQLLFFADRQEHLDSKILPALSQKKIVVSDRYKLSTVSYSSLSENEDFFAKIADDFVDPDLTIFLSINPEKALERVGTRGEKKEIFEKLDSQIIVADAYKRHVEKILAEKKLVLDATESIEVLAEKILEEVTKRIEQ